LRSEHEHDHGESDPHIWLDPKRLKVQAQNIGKALVEAGGREPGGKQLATVIEQARELKAKVIFVQPQFSRKSAKLVAEAIGGEVVAMDPLARDVIANLEKMARTVAGALE
jgi:zinc transport system substrate-binding protein